MVDTDRPCPDCGHRIGNRRRDCPTCNRFAQAVNRRTDRQLRELHPTDYDTIRISAESTLYMELTTRRNMANRYGVNT